MQSAEKWFQRRHVQAPPLQIGGRTIVLESTAYIWRWPSGGGVWHRPTSVLVREIEQTRRLPIADPTRQTIILLSGLTLAAGIFSWLLSRKRT